MLLKILILLSTASVLYCVPVTQIKITEAGNELHDSKNIGTVYFKNASAEAASTRDRDDKDDESDGTAAISGVNYDESQEIILDKKSHYEATPQKTVDPLEPNVNSPAHSRQTEIIDGNKSTEVASGNDVADDSTNHVFDVTRSDFPSAEATRELLLMTILQSRDFKRKVSGTRSYLKDFDKDLHNFLSHYYDSYIAPKLENYSQADVPPADIAMKTEEDALSIYDRMQSDQPVDDDYGFKPINVVPIHMTPGSNGTAMYETRTNDTDINQILEKRRRIKEEWVKDLKLNILNQIGRINFTVPTDNINKSLNIDNLMKNFSNNGVSGDYPIYTEKTRSYYPTCEIPKNTDQDLWKDEDTMNLYFNFEFDKNVTIATATLRLYRIPNGNLTDPLNLVETGCENVPSEDEKLLRISIYWYTKSLKRHRIKRRLCDSKVVAESAKWVELSVKPAARAWIKGSKNSGLAILVENQDGVVLKANQYFKEASCTVGTSTPKPIPTIIVDAARHENQMDRINSLLGRITTTTLDFGTTLLPTIDICTLEYLDGHTVSTQESRKIACNLKKIQDQSQRMVPGHHIRHQMKSHASPTRFGQGQENFDPRSRMIGKQIIIKGEDIGKFRSTINR